MKALVVSVFIVLVPICVIALDPSCNSRSYEYHDIHRPYLKGKKVDIKKFQKCGTPSPRHLSSVLRVKKPGKAPVKPFPFSCSCASNCINYGDCCWSKVFPETGSYTTKLRTSCVKLSLVNRSTTAHFVMVTGCRKTWPDDDVRTFCEKAQHYADMFYSNPASSSRGIVYYNGFCAMCNHDIDDDTVFWKGYRNDEKNLTQFSAPQDIHENLDYSGPRECANIASYKYVDTCRNLEQKDWVRRCGFYLALVESKVGNTLMIYKNVYCALCNGGDPSNLACLRRSLGEPQSGRLYFEWQPNLVTILHPVTRTEDCAFFQSGKCYIKSLGTSKMTSVPRDINVTAAAPAREPGLHSPQKYLTITCISISLLCFFLKVGVYVRYDRSRTFSSKCALCLSCTLFLSNLLFLVSQSLALDYIACMICGILLHYGFLSTFFWTTVISVDIWNNIVHLRCARHKRSLLKFCVMSWFPPVCIVTISIVVDITAPLSKFAPQYGVHCWFSSLEAHGLFFLAPMLTLLFVNASLYVHIVLTVRGTVKAASVFEFRYAADLSHMKLYVGLACIMGITWIFGFFLTIAKSLVTDIIVIMLIGLQGVYLFVGFKDYRFLLPSFSSRSVPGTPTTTAERTLNTSTYSTKHHIKKNSIVISLQTLQ
ncbi:uncharacterized protein LOC135389202 [Ornithodoros turicata]|uniref:uncharacterized protein LOC135389202 n=1 Tax=Ornithodoros turicata TaxID=34597 RepID=UPI00313A2F42